MSGAYYNEIDPKAAATLRELIKQGHIAPGEVDERSILDVTPADLRGFTQCHFFAGIGGWPLAFRLAGIPDTFESWTGSCPCQPFSTAGWDGGFADERHLWPYWHHLIRFAKPRLIFGEQVASKASEKWLDLVESDLEGEGYSFGPSVLNAASVGAPHLRQRIFFVADAAINGLQGVQRRPAPQIQEDGALEALGPWNGSGNPFENWKVLLAESHVARMDDGVSSMLDVRPRLHAYGNAIVPQLAAEFIQAYLETTKG